MFIYLTSKKNEFDDGKGFIGYTQVLIVLARKLHRMSSEEDLRQTFQFFDRNNDSLIDFADLKSSLFILGEKMSDEKIEEMIREADLDKDGFLNESGIVFCLF